MIKGTVRETTNFEEKDKKVGISEVKIIAINPSAEEYKELLGIELQEGSKATEYLGESRDGNTTLRLDFWGENTKTKEKDKVTFFLENKVKENKIEEGEESEKVKKYQFINKVGMCTWAADENDLKQWFTKYEYRKTFVGEEELYTFVKNWLGKLDAFKTDDMSFEWKPLMKGNVKEIRSHIGGEFSTPFLWLFEVKTVEKDGEYKQYQNVYNRNFLPSYTLQYFSQKDYNSETEINALKAKEEKLKAKKASGATIDKSDKLKNYEYFVLQVTDSQFGSKNFYSLKPLRKYNPEENPITSNEAKIPEVVGTNDLPF